MGVYSGQINPFDPAAKVSPQTAALGTPSPPSNRRYHRPTMPTKTLPLPVCLCLLSALGAQTTEHTVEIDGQERDYLLHVPASRDERPMPLVLFLHGRGGNAARASRRYGFRELADQHGFAIAFPDAPDRRRGWRPDYYQRSERGRASQSDLPFVTAVLDAVERELDVDPRRIYAAGHSAGGIMSYAVAGALAPRIAAIGVVAGSIGIKQNGRRLTIAEPTAPVAVISFHGQRDRVIPYDETHGANAYYSFFISAPDSVRFWAEHNDCAREPKRRELRDGKVVHQQWNGGSADVEFYSLVDGGHGWPSQRRDVPASELIWKFFASHPKPAQERSVMRWKPQEDHANIGRHFANVHARLSQ